MKTEAQLKHRFDTVLARADETLNRANRERELTIVAVTKRQPVSAIHEAYAYGHRHFGESQIQEAIPKIKATAPDVTWHFIGHLQKNKVRMAVKYFPYIHSVHSLQLLQRIERIAGEERHRPKVFLQVKPSPDPDKYGLSTEQLPDVLSQAMACRHLDCIGLMTIPPLALDPNQTRSYFQAVRHLRDAMVTQFPAFPGRLSMGMSRDYDIAIEQGSHYVRIGTNLFGARPQ